MRAFDIIVCGSLLLAAMPAQAGTPAPEVRLSEALKGRVAGSAVDCIQLHEIQSSEIFDKTAILYKSGTTWYLNRPTSGLNFLDRDSVLVTDTHSSELCTVDIVRLLDSGLHFPSGSLGLGKFVPYTRAR